MNISKVEFKVGNIWFVCEGDQSWVSKEADKFYEKFSSTILDVASEQEDSGDSQSTAKSKAGPRTSLPNLLKQKSATSAQVTKFLVAAIWLEDGGMSRVGTTDVAKALKDANQGRLGNPSDCLGQNIKKGFCEKDGSKFFVTPEGRQSVSM